ncbi:MAG: hypothetical protein HDT16_13705 [Oscillibacter sp.]|nr:hypothetical protein [Oscillibacter sp.]
MEEQAKKRVRRTPDQIAAEIDAKIAKLDQSLIDNDKKKDEAIQGFEQKAAEIKAKIESLQKQKEDLFAPKPPRKPRKSRKQKIDEIVKQAVKSGLKPSEVAEKLGVEISD